MLETLQKMLYPDDMEGVLHNMENHLKTGYLNQNFQLFHLKDQLTKEFSFHYHDFHKIIIFLAGDVTYYIEGKAYHLKPWDILLVNHFDIHRPVINPALPYERIILWIRTDYMQAQTSEFCDISACFKKAQQRSFSLIRLKPALLTKIQNLITELESAIAEQAFGSALLCNSLFLQFMVYINRIFLDKQYIRDTNDLQYDPGIQEILNYINRNLNGNLTCETLSEKFFISKYHLMRKFKAQTGYTLHNYVLSKRLFAAKSRIDQGMPAMKAAESCGFADYSTFSRAYKKLFGRTPKR